MGVAVYPLLPWPESSMTVPRLSGLTSKLYHRSFSPGGWLLKLDDWLLKDEAELGLDELELEEELLELELLLELDLLELLELEDMLTMLDEDDEDDEDELFLLLDDEDELGDEDEELEEENWTSMRGFGRR